MIGWISGLYIGAAIALIFFSLLVRFCVHVRYGATIPAGVQPFVDDLRGVQMLGVNLLVGPFKILQRILGAFGRDDDNDSTRLPPTGHQKPLPGQ